jgi:hypothetical protein
MGNSESNDRSTSSTGNEREHTVRTEREQALYDYGRSIGRYERATGDNNNVDFILACTKSGNEGFADGYNEIDRAIKESNERDRSGRSESRRESGGQDRSDRRDARDRRDTRDRSRSDRGDRKGGNKSERSDKRKGKN